MINIAICDDEKLFTEKLEEIINEIQFKEDYLISTYTSVIKMMQDALNKCKFDILFMDIELKQNIIGTDIASELKELYPEMLIIYVSSYDNYYKNMVQAEPFRFLSKPFEKEKIEDALGAAFKRLKSYEYTYKYGGEVHIVNLKEIVYFYSENKKVYIHYKNGEEAFFYEKLDIVESEIEKICDMFIRINKSYIINFYSMHKFKIDKICIKDNLKFIELNISRKYKNKFAERYVNRLKEKLK